MENEMTNIKEKSVKNTKIVVKKDKKSPKVANNNQDILEEKSFLKNAKIKKLILNGKEKGFLLYDEINNVLKDSSIKVEKIEELYNVLD